MKPVHANEFMVYDEHVDQKGYFNKLTTERTMFEAFPHLVDYETIEMTLNDVPAYAKGNIINKDGTLMRFFERNAKVVDTDKHYVNYRLGVGESDIRATILENVESAERLGIARSYFKIKLDVEWYGENDGLILEGAREIPLIIRSGPQPDGEGFIYDVQIITTNDAMYLPAKYLKAGTRAMQSGSFIGEGQATRGNVTFGYDNAFLEFQVPNTRMGFEHKMTDDAYSASKNFRLSDPRTEADPELKEMMPDILVNSFEMKFLANVNYQVDLWMTYGRSAGKFAGAYRDSLTNNPLKIGPGIFPFLEAAYTYDYPVEGGNLDMFSDFLQAAWHDKVDPSQRSVEIWGGTGFLRNWQRWCREAEQWGIIQDSDINYSEEEPLFEGRRGVGINRKQYRSVFLDPWGKITVRHFPLFDSEKVEPRKYRGLPITSYQALVTDYGYGQGPDSNVYLVKNSSRNVEGYNIGNFSPLGSVVGKPELANRFKQGLGRENAFMYEAEREFSCFIKDPSYMLWYRPLLG